MQELRFTTCFLGLGANLGSPIQQLQSALKNLESQVCIRNLQSSSFYGSKPMGPQDQPDYVNAVAKFETSQNPISLLDTLQKIEHDHQRERNIRWGARTLDLDILLFGNEIIHSERLEIPHPGIIEREFVLYPLFELEPLLQLPSGDKLADIIQKTPLNGLSKIETSSL